MDVSWQPDLVRSALRALRDRARHWVYVSSGSVYADDTTPGTGEESTLRPAHQGTGPVGVEDYGAAKVACEQACLSTLGAGQGAGGPRRPDRAGTATAATGSATGRRGSRVPATASRCWCRPAGAPRRSSTSRTWRSGWWWRPRRAPPVCSTRWATSRRSARCWRPPWRPRDAHRASWRPTTSGSPNGAWSRGWARSRCRSGCRGRRTPGSAPGATRRPGRAGLRLRPLADTVEAALRWERERGLERDRRAGLTPRRERRAARRAGLDVAFRSLDRLIALSTKRFRLLGGRPAGSGSGGPGRSAR